ncbi:MAG: PBP1A family penicillin-binding protein [Candidatus Paceibacterota bacterium]|jgi:1A family penicillin-binding protein
MTKTKTKKNKAFLFLKIFGTLVFLGLIILAVGLFTVAKIAKDLPNPELMTNRIPSQSTKIFDRTGQILLYEIHGDEKRTMIPFDQIPDYLKAATIAIEDKNFYTNPAFDWRGILRAFFINITRGGIYQGGSTITQQVAKTAFLTPERTYTRKIKELILSYWLEKNYSKDQILNLYLNLVPYGSNAYGVEAASQAYFSKSAKDLTLAESAYLAALTKAPSYYSPWGVHQDELEKRKNDVLKRMYELGSIDQEEEDRAIATKVTFQPQSLGSIKAPHFSIMIKSYLAEKYGEDMVTNGGLKVISTLDWDIQQIAEQTVLDGANRNTELYQGKNASLVAQDTNTGQILALVGSKDYFDTSIDGNFNVATQGLRQPGSALKPFVYLTAFEKGYAPQSLVFDVPTNFDTTGKNPYQPQNYDHLFRGPISLRESLAQSLNVPSVKTLYLAGLKDSLKTLSDFGVTTLNDPSRFGLSLVLGGGEVRLAELVNAYGTLSQEGVRHNQSFILEVDDSKGKILEKNEDVATQVTDQQYARLISSILSDPEARRPLFQSSFDLTVFPDRQVALKTGTTEDYRDAWAFGYTPSFAVGVWAGNNNNKPMQKQGGSILAAVPIWHDFLSQIFEKYPDKIPVETFNNPDPVEETKPMINGQAANHSILYFVDKNNPLGSAPEHPENDPQFNNWERSVQSWLSNH